MKKITILLLLAFISTNINLTAQIDVDKTIVEINKKRRGTMLNSINLDKHTYILYSQGRGRKNKLILKKFDNKMKLIKENELNFNPKEQTYNGFIKFKNEILLLSTLNDKKADVFSLKSQKVATDLLTLSGKKNILLDFPYESKRDIIKPIIEFSRSYKNMLVYYDINTKKKEKREMGVVLFDSNQNELWSKNIEVPFATKESSIYDVELDDRGNVYFVVRYKDPEEKRAFKFKLYSVKGEGYDTKSFDLSLDNDVIFDLKLAHSNQNEIIVAGFYSPDKKSGIKGAFYAALDIKEEKLIKQNKKEIAVELLKKGESKRTKKRIDKKQKKGKDLELFNYTIDDLILRDDGGVVMIAEKYYTYTTTTTDSKGRIRYIVHYVHGDILLTSINPTGKIEWVDKIQKLQNATTPYFSSYALAVSGSRMYLIYNDNFKNYEEYKREKKEGKRYDMNLSKKKGVVSIYEIEAEGYKRKEILFSNKELNGNAIPIQHHQISDNSLIIFVRSKKPKVALLNFK